MKFLNAAFAIAIFVAGAAQSRAEGTFDFTFDENGNGTFTNMTGATQNGYSGSSATALFSTGTDPTGSVGGNVLIYELPNLVRSGAVDIGEPGDVIGAVDSAPSDVLFFTNSNGVNDAGFDANLMIFYSLVGGGDLADSGLPSFAGTLLDAADEDANGNFIWLPGGNRYFGNSPEAPEPASLAMMLFGAGALGAGLLRRKARG